MAGNREYKSDVFSMLMEDKSKALQLYNRPVHKGKCIKEFSDGTPIGGGKGNGS